MNASGRFSRLQSSDAGLRRWAAAGVAVSLLLALPAYAPANWLAGWVQKATGSRLLLAEARGTVWRGSALPVLTGGPDSQDASALPDRLNWQLGLAFEPQPTLLIHLTQACCLNGRVALRIRPGLAGVNVRLQPPGNWVGQWPSAWLAGLGTPWNTLQLGGTMRLEARDLSIGHAAGRVQVSGSAAVELGRMSSPMSTLPVLGSYRLALTGSGAGPAQLALTTLEGPLQLSGSGEWATHGVRFRGEARAAASEEAVLSNLLNIIGRRDKARSIISIG